MAAAKALLSIENLSLEFTNGHRVARVLKDVSIRVDAGETIALVGESGSGTSVCQLSILKLLRSGKYPGGKIIWRGERDILQSSESELQSIRGNRIAMIFQEPMTALNPLHTIGKQIAESIEIHHRLPENKIHARVMELLGLVGLKDAARFTASYPHELSGGQRQRVLIAMARANNPDLLIADEPTNALDVTVQEQILELLQGLQKKLGMAMILITHDLNLVRRMASRVYALKDGCVPEESKKVMRRKFSPIPIILIPIC